MSDDTPAQLPHRPIPDVLAGPHISRRGRRVLLLVVALWILNGFDLAFTIIAVQTGNFNEENPIARRMLEHPYRLMAFKIGAVAVASAILIAFRHLRLVEVACWGLCLVYVALSYRWLVFFNDPERLSPAF